MSGLGENIVQMFCFGQGVRVTFGETPTQPHRGTFTPLIPLSLRAVKGEGEIRTEAEVGASAPTSASSSVLGRRGWGWILALGGRNDGGGGWGEGCYPYVVNSFPYGGIVETR